jgi:hypothetical protein
VPQRGQAESEVHKKVSMPPKTDDEWGDDEFRSLWAELGLPEPEFLDESRAPPVDRDLIRKMMRRELPKKAADEVYRYIMLFRNWSEAHKEIVDEALDQSG